MNIETQRVNNLLSRVGEVPALIAYSRCMEILSRIVADSERLRLDAGDCEARLILRTDYDYETDEWLTEEEVFSVHYDGETYILERGWEWRFVFNEDIERLTLDAVALTLHKMGVKELG